MSYSYSVMEMNVLLFKKMLTLLFLFSLYKLNSRKSTLSKTAEVADGSRREALMKVIMREFMLSEESGDEMIDDKRRAVIKVKPLPLRSIAVLAGFLSG